MSSLQIQRWTAKEVADWLRGLDDSLKPYIQSFLSKGYTGERLMRLTPQDLDYKITKLGHQGDCLDDSLKPYIQSFLSEGYTGERLLRLTPQDLDELKITKLGHQEVLLEAVELLKSINYDQPEENLQSILLRLNTKATNLYNELEKLSPGMEQAIQQVHASNSGSTISLPANILLRIADTVTAAKTLISWLDRPPFCKGDDDFQVVRREILDHALKITQAVQKSTDVTASINTIKSHSEMMMTLTDSTIKQATDPLVISPTFIDEVTIKKKHQDEELGLFLKTSSIDGVHFITGTKDQSAAGVVGKVHSGDEVLCVNYQTVIAWDHKKVIDLVKEDPMTVTLTLRKRPKNLSTSGQFQRSQPNSFPIYSGRIRPVVQEKTSQAQRSRKNSDPTTLRVAMREREEPTGPRGYDRPMAHSDNETTEPLDIESTFEDRGKIVRRETAGASMLRRPPGSSKSNRHSQRPRSLPEDIAEVITTAVEDWLRPPITGSPQSSDSSQQTPSPKTDAIASSMKKDEEKKKKSVRINTNNNTESSYDHDRRTSTMSSASTMSEMSTMSTMSQMSTASQFSGRESNASVPSYKTIIMDDGEEVKVPKRRKKRRGYTVNKHISCVDLGPGTCEGFLHLRKSRKRVGGYKWSKLWFVLKEYVLYYYETKQDETAKGVICLPGYKVNEASEVNAKHAFKAVHENTQPIYFQAGTESDKLKWINKLGLAAIMCNERPVRQSKIYREGLVSLKKSASTDDIIDVVDGAATPPGQQRKAADDEGSPMPKIDGWHSDADDDSDTESNITTSSAGSMSPSIRDNQMSPIGATSPPSGQTSPSPSASSADTPQRPPLLKGQALDLSSPTSPTAPDSMLKDRPLSSPIDKNSLSPLQHAFSKHNSAGSLSQSPFMKRLKATPSNSGPLTPTNTPVGSPTILKRLMTAVRRRSEATMTFHPDQFLDKDPKSSHDKMQRSLSTPEFLDKSVDSDGISSLPGSPELGGRKDLFREQIRSIKRAKVGLTGLERSTSVKRTDYFRQQLKVDKKNKANEKVLEKRALERTLRDRKNELERIEALFADSICHDKLNDWRSHNEDLLTHTIERLTKAEEKDSPQLRRDSSSDPSESPDHDNIPSIEGAHCDDAFTEGATPGDVPSTGGAAGLLSVEGIEQISGMARSSLVLVDDSGRPRAESECSETSI